MLAFAALAVVAWQAQDPLSPSPLDEEAYERLEDLARLGVRVDPKRVHVAARTSEVVFDFQRPLEDYLGWSKAEDALLFMMDRFREIEMPSNRAIERDVRISSFPEPTTKTFYLLADDEVVLVTDRMADGTDRFGIHRKSRSLAHGLVHAWQDLVHGVGSLYERRGNTIEEFYILHCVVEGQAELLADASIRGFRELLMDPWYLDGFDPETSGGSTRLCEPRFLPYSVGTHFLLGAYLDAGADGVTSALDRLPQSTEQIIHRRKLGIDAPTSVALGPMELPGRRDVIEFDGVVGELGIRSLLLTSTYDDGAALLASTGWDGDRLQIARGPRGGQRARWRIVFDRARDAEQFAEAAERLMEGRFVVNGRVFDWAYATDAGEQDAWLRTLESAPSTPDDDPIGALTTAWIERDLSGSLFASIFTVHDMLEGRETPFRARAGRYEHDIDGSSPLGATHPQVALGAERMAAIGVDLEAEDLDFERLPGDALTAIFLDQRERHMGTSAGRAAEFLDWACGHAAEQLWPDVSGADPLAELFLGLGPVGGVYLPNERKIVLRDRFTTTLTLAHEMVHAWQDQLDPGLEGRYGLVDESLESLGIRQCLIEGQADFLAIAMHEDPIGWMERGRPSLGDEPLDHSKMSGSPTAYTAGCYHALVQYVEGGLDAVRSMMDDSVPSTEQLLHPSKRGRDVPTLVELPAGLGEVAGTPVGVETVVGELALYDAIHRSTRDRTLAATVGCGWDGDFLKLFVAPDGSDVAVWRTLWDREVDADQFQRFADRILPGRTESSGRLVDWVYSNDVQRVARLLDFLEASRDPPPAAICDVATTAWEERWHVRFAGDDLFGHPPWTEREVVEVEADVEWDWDDFDD